MGAGAPALDDERKLRPGEIASHQRRSAAVWGSSCLSMGGRLLASEGRNWDARLGEQTIDAVEASALVGLLPAFAAAGFAYRQAKSAQNDAGRAERRADIAEKAARAAQEQAEAAQLTAEATRAGVEATQAGVEAAREATRTQAILDLEEELARHAEVHAALTDGQWFQTGQQPSRAQWVAVETYMGLFERVETLVVGDVLQPAAVEENYGYRIGNLITDELVYREKLVKRADYWRGFIRLWEQVDQAHRARLGRPLTNRSLEERDADERRFREEKNAAGPDAG